MATQIIWVHGNSGNLQVVEEKWGESTPAGWGIFLEGEVQHAANYDEPWVHFHIPMTSLAVESAHQLPRLRQVMLQFTTDYDAPDANPDWVQESDNFYKYPTDDGGAFITQLHVYDGPRRIFAKDDLHWHSPRWDAYVVENLVLPQEIGIRYGLGLSVRVRYKNQMRIQRLAAHPVGNKQSMGMPVAGYVPEENPGTRTRTKRAFLSAIGCEFVPAAP